ncbi:MAG: exo-beta-N-acetylmuramidase NamZ domain-containing protein [Chitinophagales bacterium]
MLHFFSTLSWIFLFTGCNSKSLPPDENSVQKKIQTPIVENAFDTTIISGAEQTESYIPLIKDKYVALVVNQTSIIGRTHLVDSLLSLGINIPVIFSPEHGFRGTEDAGATIQNSKDSKTGIPIISLYGNKKKPATTDLQDADVVIFDIQDVGARFYTYISTLHYVMEACAENNKQLIILDRPNPNGYYVDGPVLQKEFTSFVGLHPVPVVHGMTVGEYAKMINGEGWLAGGVKCNLIVIASKNYEHADFYELKIPPSPNLRTMHAIYLYPSLCFFEGTNVSVGRGTVSPFEIYGSPMIRISEFSFTPKSGPGSKTPPFMNQLCYGVDLSKQTLVNVRKPNLNLGYLLDAYSKYSQTDKFFLSNNFFNKLAGNDELIKQIEAGLTEDEIRLTWQEDLKKFKELRAKYLLYTDFE